MDDTNNPAVTAADEIPFGTTHGADEPVIALSLDAGAGHIAEFALPDDVRRLQVAMRRDDDGSLRVAVYGRRADHSSYDLWVLRTWDVKGPSEVQPKAQEA